MDSINFIKMYEFREFTNELALGRVITIEKNEDTLYRLALMSIDYDHDSTGSFSMTFSNASKPGDTAMTFADLIKESSSTSRTVSANWSNLTDYSRNKDSITDLLKAPLDRTLRAAQKDMSSQAFVIDDTGILGRKRDVGFDGSGSMFLPEQIRIINNTILFTNDNWNTASLALGKIYDGNGSYLGYGLAADVLIGELILGETISIGSKSERVRIDDSGITIKNNAGESVFEADEDGNLTIKGNGEFTGKITATDGEFNGTIYAKAGGAIGGYTIGNDMLVGNGVGIGSISDKENSNRIAFWAGNSDATNAPFRVGHDGYLYATNADIRGRIDAIEGGTIGGFTIGKNSIYNGTNSLDSKDDGIYIGIDGINAGGNFTVSKDGGVKILKGMIKLGGTKDDGTEFSSTLTSNGIDSLAVLNNEAWSIHVGYSDVKMSTEYNNPDLYTYVGTHNLSIYSSVYNGYNIHSNNGLFISTGDSPVLNSASLCIGGVLTPDKISMSANGGIDLSPGVGDAKGYFYGNWIATSPIGGRSDVRVKNSIESLDERYAKVFDRLRPCRFKYNYDKFDKFHTGFIAQDVEKAVLDSGLTIDEFAAIVIDSDGKYALRYSEIISLCVMEIQKLKRMIISYSRSQRTER